MFQGGVGGGLKSKEGRRGGGGEKEGSEVDLAGSLAALPSPGNDERRQSEILTRAGLRGLRASASPSSAIEFAWAAKSVEAKRNDELVTRLRRVLPSSELRKTFHPDTKPEVDNDMIRCTWHRALLGAEIICKEWKQQRWNRDASGFVPSLVFQAPEEPDRLSALDH